MGIIEKNFSSLSNKNLDELSSKDNAFFSVNVVARKPEKNTSDTNPYVAKFLKATKWEPNKIDVFAGVVDYPTYNFFDRFMIRLIMWITNGPTDVKAIFEFTDWKRVEDFSKSLIKN